MASLKIVSKKVKVPGGDYAVVCEPRGSIDATSSLMFEEEMTRLLKMGTRYLIINCGKLNYVNSSAMGVLIKCSDQMQDRDGSLELYEVSDKVRTMFGMLGLESLFTFHATEQECVKAIARAQRNRISQKEPVSEAEVLEPLEAELYTPGEDGPSEEVHADKSHLGFPLKFSCAGCTKRLRVDEPGKYRCPNCGVFYSASDEGKVKAFLTVAPKKIEVRFPISVEYIEPLRRVGKKLAEEAGFDSDFVHNIEQAIDEACGLVMQSSDGLGGEFEAFLVVDEDEYIVALKVKDRKFEQNVRSMDAAAQMRMTLLQNCVDTMQYFDLPSGGQILKLTKKR
ncbi:MAG: anti-sigma factor antagonist [Planctomycetes bacterium]|nr:anti-sigma factor antagonist [Planctomycetota bacterium]